MIFGHQIHSHVFGFEGEVKAKDMRGGISSKVELLSDLSWAYEKNKSFIWWI